MIDIELVFTTQPRKVACLKASLPNQSTIQDALIHFNLLDDFEKQALTVGVWGKKSDLQTVLKTGDRIELYQALRVDPKVARRERFKQQGMRRAGLFDKKPSASQK